MTVSKTPHLLVLIVNWNGRQHLKPCLSSLLASSYPSFDIVVIDNGSNDNSVKWVRSHFSQVHVLPLNSNCGFAAANNIGLRIALSDAVQYAVLLNNDTRVETDSLEALVEVAERNPRAAICQARQRTWDGQHEVRFRFIPAWAEAHAELTAIMPPTTPTPTSFASGCAMLVRCSLLEYIGLFDERYFMYVEDVDLTLRAWIAGYQVMDVPASIVYHRMTGSASQPQQRMLWGYRNQLTTLLKLYEPRTLRRFANPILQRWFLTRNRTALRGTLAALAMLPGTLAQRRQVQSNRRAPDTQFLELCHS